MDSKKVFISYCWSSPAHEDWVLELANRLVQDGVDTILDKWDLKEGHDKYHFMESMVKSSDVHKVLIILDEKYSERANERKGGVGTETLIITPQLYENVVQEKFIPIVAEVDIEGKPFLPLYLSTRIYIDLSSKEHFEDNYEKLLRSIFNRPNIAKPSLGKAPKYIFEDSPVRYKTTTMVRALDSHLDKSPGRANGFLNDFLDEFFSNLQAFNLEDYEGEKTYLAIGEEAYNRLNQYKPLKADYVSFMSKLIKSSVEFNHDILLQFFEKLPMLLFPTDEKQGSWQQYYYDHFKLIIHELFLYTVGLALRYHHYVLLRDLLHSAYLIKERYSRSQDAKNFTDFRYHYNMMDEFFKKRDGRNYYSTHADYIINNIPDGVDKSVLTNADMLCYYVGRLNHLSWFPITYIYRGDSKNTFDVLPRLVSKKHFDKIKEVLGVADLEALKSRIVEINSEGRERGYSSGFADPIPGFDQYITVEQIGTAL